MYVYILECADGTFYIGVTNNVGRRFIEHMSGLDESSFTFSKRPLKLVFCKEFDQPMNAIRYEKQLKGWTRAKKEALIEGNIKKLHELSKCTNETSHTNFRVRVSLGERSRTKPSNDPGVELSIDPVAEPNNDPGIELSINPVAEPKQ